mmetsp:Transcript_80201/g.194362  ORF Transcript_80201/g.194362 Transcript_80201/m.194362 type:complete len:294 (+) Transcript_80201:415-1296(+)
METLPTMTTAVLQMVVVSFSNAPTLSSSALRELTLVARTMHTELKQTRMSMKALTAKPRRNVSSQETCRFSQMMLSGWVAKRALSRRVAPPCVSCCSLSARSASRQACAARCSLNVTKAMPVRGVGSFFSSATLASILFSWRLDACSRILQASHFSRSAGGTLTSPVAVAVAPVPVCAATLTSRHASRHAFLSPRPLAPAPHCATARSKAVAAFVTASPPPWRARMLFWWRCSSASAPDLPTAAKSRSCSSMSRLRCARETETDTTSPHSSKNARTSLLMMPFVLGRPSICSV